MSRTGPVAVAPAPPWITLRYGVHSVRLTLDEAEGVAYQLLDLARLMRHHQTERARRRPGREERS